MSKLKRTDTELVATRLKALSNPGRLQIFRQLALSCEPGASCGTDEQAMRRCVGELGRDLGLAPSTVSHHIKELRQAGLVRVERRGQSIHCWIDPEAVRSLADFFEQSWTACRGVDRPGPTGFRVSSRASRASTQGR
jgi:ArsR family transcriptional regulator